MKKLTVDTQFRNDAIVLRVTGNLDFETSGLLAAPLHTLQLDGRTDLVVDLSEVGLIDSTGLTVLIEAHRRGLLRGRTLLIRGASDQALRLFTLTGADRELTIDADLGTAS